MRCLYLHTRGSARLKSNKFTTNSFRPLVSPLGPILVLFDITVRAEIQTGLIRVINKSRVEKFDIFTALRGMQTRASDENSVCLSVCLSNA